MHDELRKRSLFREVNERIRGINAEFDVLGESYEVLCECGLDGCVERVEVPARVFEEVRTDGARFLVTRGHEQPEHEHVLSHNGKYAIVALRPAAA
jgi:hypothetical protein